MENLNKPEQSLTEYMQRVKILSKEARRLLKHNQLIKLTAFKYTPKYTVIDQITTDSKDSIFDFYCKHWTDCYILPSVFVG